MMTKQEFLRKELIHEIQRVIWQYELEGISMSQLCEALKVIIEQYDVKSDTIVLDSVVASSIISQKK